MSLAVASGCFTFKQPDISLNFVLRLFISHYFECFWTASLLYNLALSIETQHQHKAAIFLCHHFHWQIMLCCIYKQLCKFKICFQFVSKSVCDDFYQNSMFAISAAQSRSTCYKQLEFELDIVCQNKPKCFFDIKKLLFY